jgi:hypothetical protein
MKIIVMCLGLVAATALVSTIGCDSGGMPAQDMGMVGGGGGDMAMMQGGNPDMSCPCVANPMMGDDFLNSCAPASVQSVPITPFYPTLAPNGVLPPLN